MAQNPKVLRIIGTRDLGPVTRAIVVECVVGGALDAIGGKYIIVHTGLSVGDKAVKRAYSLIPIAGAPHRAELRIKRLDGGLGSSALHEAPIGAELTFSGPWGKLLPESGLADRTLLVATDTGITSALGLALHAREMKTRAPSEVLWLRAADERFLDVDRVRKEIEACGVRFVSTTIAPIGALDRVAAAFRHIEARIMETSAELVIATGDGAIVHPLRERLAAACAGTVRDVRLECFFHNPEKKSA